MIINLPDAAINGAKKKRVDWNEKLKDEYIRCGFRLRGELPKFEFKKLLEKWRGRKDLENNSKESYDRNLSFRKLHNKLTAVSATKCTGNLSDDDIMRYATGFYNKAIKMSNICDGVHKKNTELGSSFPILKYITGY